MLGPAGDLLYSTHLGGSTGDYGSSIAVDAAGNIYVAGVALSTNFPMAGALQPQSGGGADANVFNERGLQCLNLSNGMIDIHTPDERIAVEDLERMVDVTLALVEVARAT